MFACMNRLINFDFNNMHKQALGDLRHVVVIVVIGFVFPHPTGLAVFEPDVPSGAFGEICGLFLWNGMAHDSTRRL